MPDLALGAAVDFSGVTLPFNPADLISSAMGLLTVVGPFVLVGLAIIFVPKIIGVVRAAAATRNGKN